MRTRSALAAATYVILGSVAILSFALPDKLTIPDAGAAAGPAELHLVGVLRDFKIAHTDFDVAVVGHTAGNVQEALDPAGRPVFAAGGYLVSSQWEDTNGNAIAPHLFEVAGGGGGGGGGPVVPEIDGEFVNGTGLNASGGGLFGTAGVHVKETIVLDKSVFDSFDSSAGIYGGANSGGDLEVTTNSTASAAIYVDADGVINGDALVGPGGSPASGIDNNGVITGALGTLAAPYVFPTVIVPDYTIVGVNLGNKTISGGATVTINTNRHYDDLRISTNAVVTIDGDVTILVEGDFTTETGGSIVVTPGSSFDIYVLGDVTLKTKSPWSDPASTRLWVVGNPQFKIETEANFFGTIIAPDASLLLKTKGAVYGSYLGRALECQTEGTIHADRHAINFRAVPQSVAGRAIAVDGKITTGDPGTIVDAYDSSSGPYGGPNAGLDVVLSTNAVSSNIVDIADTTITGHVLAGPGADPDIAIKRSSCTINGVVGTLDTAVVMPVLAAPTGLGPNIGDVTYVGGVATLDHDLHCAKFSVDGGAILNIAGNVTIRCTSEFKVSASEVRLMPDSTLELYVEGDFKLENAAKFNANTGDTRRVHEYHILPGNDNIKVDGGSEFHGRIQDQGGSLTVSGSQFYGTYIGGELTAEGAAGVHIDLATGTSEWTGGCGERRILLVVGNAASLSTQDAAKRTAIESWGHPVTVIDDEATQAEVNTAVAGCDVVYISEEVSHGSVGNKYKLVTIGVVNEDKDLSDAELGFSASFATYTGTQIEVTDNTHPITDGFPLGPVAVTSVDWNFSRADGGLASGADRLADKVGQAMPVLMAIDTGEFLYGDIPAPAHRVRLPWGNHSTDFTTINLIGLSLMKRAVEWAGCGNPPPACLTVADTAGSAGTASDAHIDSATSFGQWYRDIPGVNTSAIHTLVLTEVSGVYEYLTDAFHPADGRLYGNEGETHNNNFTYRVRATFNYTECSGQFIEFEGGDGTWFFVDGRLVMDLGGVRPLSAQYIDVDRLGLSDGGDYTLDVMYANRNAGSSTFRLRTNLELSTDSIMQTVSTQGD